MVKLSKAQKKAVEFINENGHYSRFEREPTDPKFYDKTLKKLWECGLVALEISGEIDKDFVVMGARTLPANEELTKYIYKRINKWGRVEVFSWVDKKTAMEIFSSPQIKIINDFFEGRKYTNDKEIGR